MELREDVYDIKKELQEVKQESFALGILKDYKKQNKRLFIILVIVLIMWFATVCYLVYTLNDIGSYTEDTIDIEDVESIDNSHIKIGDEIWEKSN